MGDCKFCGRPAGIFRSMHKECEYRHNTGKAQIVAMVGRSPYNLHHLTKEIEKVASLSYIPDRIVRQLVAEGWQQALERALNDHIISVDEQQQLADMQKHFHIPQSELERIGAWDRLIKAIVLREVIEGTIPQRFRIDGMLPFNLQKSETLVWAFEDVEYYEDRTRTHYKGGSSGMSFRVAKGVYYRTGGFKGERVQTTETTYVDSGLMGITTKHIYFAGAQRRSFRIHYNKIVTFDPFADGITVMRDAQTAKPQIFRNGDGWFTYNLVSNLAQML